MFFKLVFIVAVTLLIIYFLTYVLVSFQPLICQFLTNGLSIHYPQHTAITDDIQMSNTKKHGSVSS